MYFSKLISLPNLSNCAKVRIIIKLIHLLKMSDQKTILQINPKSIFLSLFKKEIKPYKKERS